MANWPELPPGAPPPAGAARLMVDSLPLTGSVRPAPRAPPPPVPRSTRLATTTCWWWCCQPPGCQPPRCQHRRRPWLAAGATARHHRRIGRPRGPELHQCPITLAVGAEDVGASPRTGGSRPRRRATRASSSSPWSSSWRGWPSSRGTAGAAAGRAGPGPGRGGETPPALPIGDPSRRPEGAHDRRDPIRPPGRGRKSLASHAASADSPSLEGSPWSALLALVSFRSNRTIP